MIVEIYSWLSKFVVFQFGWHVEIASALVFRAVTSSPVAHA
jgi:hypothetical protein